MERIEEGVLGLRKKVIVIQGGQYGSEAKGLVAGWLARKVDIGIRTGTINAGHTVYYRGQPFKMQQLPCTWVNRESAMVLGPGAFIHWETLEREINLVAAATRERPTIYIDPRCGIHRDRHTEEAQAANRHHAIGTTGKGCSNAVVEKVTNRHLGYMTAGDNPDIIRRLGLHLTDTVAMINDAYDSGLQLLVEGTQGTLLDLHLGPYPYTTHKQTQAANWLAECGLASTIPHELVLVMRTMPIRVAGNSGPLPRECSWHQWGMWMNHRMGEFGGKPLVDIDHLHEWDQAVRDVLGRDYPTAPPTDPAHWSQLDRERCREAASETHCRAWELLTPQSQQHLGRFFERTTVTNKLRRLAQWDEEDTKVSLRLNRPTSIFLTFANYLVPTLWGVMALTGHRAELQRLKLWCQTRGIWEQLHGAGFGPEAVNCFTKAQIEAAL